MQYFFNLDIWRTFLEVFSLRRGGTSGDPSVTDMDMLDGVNIVLFPKKGKGFVEVKADVDENIPYSILQKSVLDRLNLKSSTCQKHQFTDVKGRTHTPIGQIELQWHKAGIAIENTETFCVVESGIPNVWLKFGNKNADTGTRPVALGAQTAEEQALQAQRKAEAEKKRAEEKKRQEERDREKQQQQASRQ